MLRKQLSEYPKKARHFCAKSPLKEKGDAERTPASPSGAKICMTDAYSSSVSNGKRVLQNGILILPSPRWHRW